MRIISVGFISSAGWWGGSTDTVRTECCYSTFLFSKICLDYCSFTWMSDLCNLFCAELKWNYNKEIKHFPEKPVLGALFKAEYTDQPLHYTNTSRWCSCCGGQGSACALWPVCGYAAPHAESRALTPVNHFSPAQHYSFFSQTSKHKISETLAQFLKTLNTNWKKLNCFIKTQHSKPCPLFSLLFPSATETIHTAAYISQSIK